MTNINMDLPIISTFLNRRKYTTINCTILWVRAEKILIATRLICFFKLYKKHMAPVLITPDIKLIKNPGVNRVPIIIPWMRILKNKTSKAIFFPNFTKTIIVAKLANPNFIHGKGFGITVSNNEK